MLYESVEERTVNDVALFAGSAGLGVDRSSAVMPAGSGGTVSCGLPCPLIIQAFCEIIKEVRHTVV